MGKFSIVKGDIVKSKTDAIVNAANTSLLGGGGVDGAIHRAAGKELLASCYKNCLKLAVENNIKTIAFPSISTGVYRFPVEQAAEIAVNEILGFLYEHDEIDSVTMVCYDENTYKVYKKAYENALKK